MKHQTSPAIFVGKRVEQLSLLIEQQFEPVFHAGGLVVPIRSCSILTTIEPGKGSTAADLARDLEISHQLVTQKIPALLELELIRREPDPKDKRRKVFHLTEKGQSQIDRLAAISPDVEKAYQGLSEEIGVDLFETLGMALQALTRRPLVERLGKALG